MTTKPPTRRPGRPSKAEGASFPVDELDRLLVHGEAGEDGLLRYPSYRELGARFGVAHSVVADYARRHNCRGRREQATADVRERVGERVVAMRAEQAAVEEAALLRMLDRYFLAFEQALLEGRVRCDSPSDFNLMCRLKAFLQGDADSRSEVVDGISLEELQKRHRAMLDDLANAKADEDEDDEDGGKLH